MDRKIITHGICDDEFIRGNVPMTKEEVREISLCKLRLTSDAVVYDVGSGTGSVAVEIACLSPEIQVFAFENNPEAVELINQNKQKFGCKNLTVISGTAPESFKDIPSPTHAFIGGTKGQLDNILTGLLSKNDRMRIVMNAVSLESICEMNNALKKINVCNDEIIQVSVSRAKKIGSYNMLNACNPIFVFAFNFDGTEKING